MYYLKISQGLLCLSLALRLLGFPSLLLAHHTGDSLPDWFEDRTGAIVRIETSAPHNRSSSTSYKPKILSNGVIISDQGIILTVAHGLGDKAPKRAPTVILKDRNSYRAEVLVYDEHLDIAVLSIDREEAFPFVPVSVSSQKIGSVWSLGQSSTGKFHLHQGETVAEGINLTSKELKLVKRKGSRKVPLKNFTALPNLIIHRAFVKEGFSGGALFNASGELVGINFGRAGTKQQGLSFSLSVRNYQAALHSYSSIPVLLSNLDNKVFRYDWFLNGIRQDVGAEGLAKQQLDALIDRVRFNGLNFKKSWRCFATFKREGRVDC